MNNVLESLRLGLDTEPSPKQLSAYQEWAAEQSAKYTRDVLFTRNAGAWLARSVEALSEQGEFTPNAVLKSLLETYEQKVVGK